ncbi:MAG TPA: universal stress protein [Propionibacteriaceae bacterium]|nr:universal stress protein [Propionibacteriaceae bacterium]
MTFSTLSALDTMHDAGPAHRSPAHPRLIAVGVDGSAQSAGTVQYAVDLAAERHGRLLVVTALRVPYGPADLVAGALDHAQHAAAARIRLAMSQVQVPPWMPVDELVTEGDPARVLAEVDASADVLVIGRHHAEFLSLLFAQPVASAVVVSAVRPVIVVPPGWDRRPFGNSPIVVALDGETAADAVLDFAFAEAEFRKTSVWALHVVSNGLDEAGFDAERANLAEILAGHLQDHPDIRVRMRLVPDDPTEQIVRLSTTAGLVVVGEPHRIRGGPRARSIARTVLDRTRCPLAIVPPLARCVVREVGSADDR